MKSVDIDIGENKKCLVVDRTRPMKAIKLITTENT